MFSESVDGALELEQWAEDLGVVGNENLVVKRTPQAGVGVFFSGFSQIKVVEDVEILRIPKKATLNIDTLRSRTEGLSEEDKKTVKVLLARYCGVSSVNETNIILGYLLGFLVLKKQGGVELSRYLDILMTTHVGSLHSDNPLLLEDFLSAFDGNSMVTALGMDLLDDKWYELGEWINGEFDVQISREEILQLNAAVRSRTLEIPCIMENEEEDDDDFVVDVTLVPVMDFVNHDNAELNAYFDVDKTTGDVVLMLDRDKVKTSEEEFQVFISYSLQEDMNKFFMNYGFVPTSNVEKVLELPVFGYFNSKLIESEKLNDRIYALRQSPNVQFLVNYKDGAIDTVQCIAEETYAYFAFVESIDWSKYDSQDFSTELELSDFQEGYERCYEIYSNLSEQEVLAAQAKFVEYVQEFFSDFIKRIDKFMEFVNEYEFNKGETSNITTLLKLYKQLAIKFTSLKSADDILSFENNQDWLPLRLMPMYNFKSSLLDKEGIDIGELKIS